MTFFLFPITRSSSTNYIIITSLLLLPSIKNCNSNKITFPNNNNDKSINNSISSSNSTTRQFSIDNIRSMEDISDDDDDQKGVYTILGLSDRKLLGDDDEEEEDYWRRDSSSSSSWRGDNYNQIRLYRGGDREEEDDKNKWPRRSHHNRLIIPPPDEKTISFQLLDSEPYHHGRPAWPHDEYILGYFNTGGGLGYNNRDQYFNNTIDDADDGATNQPPSSSNSDDDLKYYEWKKLQMSRLPQSSSSSSTNAFIGPGFYDVGSSIYDTGHQYDSGGRRLYYPVQQDDEESYRYQQHKHHHHETKITNAAAAAAAESGKVVESESSGGGVPGKASESSTSSIRHYNAPYLPHEFYKRKRLRLQIHPGLIAAPLAGLAAFGAASALTSKPLLVELGYVRNKPELIGNGGGGWGLAGSLGNGGYRPYPPFYPPPNPPPLLHPHYPGGGLPHLGGVGSASIAGGGHGGHHHPGHHHGHGGPLYPILRPFRGGGSGDRASSSQSSTSSWWNPFSALTPRLVIE